MNYNEALTKSMLLDELTAVAKELSAKAMTEKILLGVHYRKARAEWGKAVEEINSEADATDEVKAETINKKAQEECELADRRMTAEVFEQVVAAVMQHETMPSFLAPAGEDGKPGELTAEAWLEIFAANLVETA